jgi:hypothetical protein
LESVGKPWLKPKGPSLVQQMVQLVSPSKQARGYRRKAHSSLDDVTQFDKDRSTKVRMVNIGSSFTWPFNFSRAYVIVLRMFLALLCFFLSRDTTTTDLIRCFNSDLMQ